MFQKPTQLIQVYFTQTPYSTLRCWAKRCQTIVLKVGIWDFFLSVVKVTKHFLKDIWLISLIILMDYQKSKYFVPSIHKSKKLVINWDDLVFILIHHYMEGTMDKSTPRINCIIFHYYIPAIQSFCSFGGFSY